MSTRPHSDSERCITRGLLFRCGTPTFHNTLIITIIAWFYHFFIVDLNRNSISILLFIMAAPPPQNFPYDYLFKVLIIGDASVGKVWCTGIIVVTSDNCLVSMT